MRFLFIVILLLAIGGGAYVYANGQELATKTCTERYSALIRNKVDGEHANNPIAKGIVETMINSTVPPLVKSELEKANTNGTSYPEIWVRCLLASDEQLEEHVGKKLKLDSIK